MRWPFKSSGRVRDEAAAWVARRKGNPDEVAEDAFRRWYGESDRHAAAYNRLAAIWEVSGQVSRASATAPASNAGGGFARGRRLALAASLFGLVALAAAVLLAARTTVAGPGRILLASAVGEILPYALSDGSKVVLDTQSKVTIAYSGKERRLSLLAGRARFIVARDPRPFAVRAAGRELVATGTTFDVSVIEAEPAVHMLEGSLEVRGKGWTDGMPVARLRAGDDVVLARSGAPVGRKSGQSGASWPRRMLAFEATPLREAVALANRYSRTKVRLADPALGSRTVTGAYRAGDAAAFARSLAVAFGLEMSRTADGTIVLSEPDRS